MKPQVSRLQLCRSGAAGVRHPMIMLASCLAAGMLFLPAYAVPCSAQEIAIGSQDQDGAAFEEDLGFLIEDDDEIISIEQGDTLEFLQQQEAQENEKEQLIEETALILPPADAQSVGAYLGALTASENPTGSDGELAMSAWIETQMAQLGYTVTEQPFHEGFLNESFTDVPGVNVIAERGADSETRGDGILILCAHYDSKTDASPEDPFGNEKSGTAVLLETARLLHDVRTDIDLCFLFLSGEEDGGYGALRFVESLAPEHLARIRGVLYVGPVGRDEKIPYYVGTMTGEENDLSGYLSAAGHIIFAREVTTSETETALPFQEAPEKESKRGSWSVIAHLGFGAASFAQVPLTTTYLFQNVTGEYTPSLETEMGSLTGTEQETETEQESGMEPETDPGQQDADPEQLAKVADVIARCASVYMTSGGV